MTNKINILFALGIGLFILTTVTFAQDEQWLQYHLASDISSISSGSARQNLDIITERPTGIELPEFTGENQIFTKWYSPMVENDFLWVVLDQNDINGLYDTVYIDSNGDGRLNDENAVKAHRKSTQSLNFDPVKVIFQIEDGPVSYYLNFQYSGTGSTKEIRVSAGGWYQGDIKINDEKMICVLLDYNTNGRFDDVSLEPESSDRIRISVSNNIGDTRYVGKYIDINGILYELEIAPDGAYVKLTKAEGVIFGEILLPEFATELSASGENGQFTIKLENGLGTLPVGKYQVNGWLLKHEDDEGKLWKMQGTRRNDTLTFDVDQSKETELSVGQPIEASLGVTSKGRQHSFVPALKAPYNEFMAFTYNNSRPPMKVNIKNEDGTYDRNYSFSYT